MKIKATLSDREQKFNVNHRKERKLDHSIKVMTSDFEEIIDCRVYFPAQQAYCCLWVHCGNAGQGSYYTTGYGYHKVSSAIAGAIYNAGYDLSYNVDGAGMERAKEALLAVARVHVGSRKKLYIVEAYA